MTPQGILPKTIKTRLIYYHIDISTEEGKAEYNNLVQFNKALGRKLFNFISFHSSEFKKIRKELSNKDITLETKYLFNNQWNIEEGYRIFDWEEIIAPNKNIKIGSYIIPTQEMIEVRKAMTRCHYCGEMQLREGVKECRKCGKKEYLIDLTSQEGFETIEIK